MVVTVVMTTYNPTPEAPRFRYASECLKSLRMGLMAHTPINYHLADDGSPDQKALHELAIYQGASFTTIKHNGIGASLNAALRSLAGPWMYTTDDWRLTGYLDLDFPLWLLDQGYDMVRLGPIHPNLRCFTRHHAGNWWLHLDTTGEGFVFATRPFLAAPSLFAKVGPFLEGVDAYECERNYSQRVHGWGGFVQVAAVNLLGPWQHIGEYEVGDLPITNELFQMEKVPPANA